MSQVKLVFTSNANPMLWLVVEDLLHHLKSQEMKASVFAEETWKMKRICMESSSSTCPNSRVKTTPRPTSHGHSRLTRSSASITTPVMQPDLRSSLHHVRQRQEPHSRPRSRRHGREEGR